MSESRYYPPPDFTRPPPDFIQPFQHQQQPHTSTFRPSMWSWSETPREPGWNCPHAGRQNGAAAGVGFMPTRGNYAPRRPYGKLNGDICTAISDVIGVIFDLKLKHMLQKIQNVERRVSICCLVMHHHLYLGQHFAGHRGGRQNYGAVNNYGQKVTVEPYVIMTWPMARETTTFAINTYWIVPCTTYHRKIKRSQSIPTFVTPVTGASKTKKNIMNIFLSMLR